MSSTSRNKSPSRLREHGVPQAGEAVNDVSALETHLGYWLRFVSNHVSHAFKVKVEREGVTVAEWVVLRALYSSNDMRPSDLAERVGLSRGAVSKLVDRLLRKKLLRCRSDTVDRRAQVLSLSASGLKLVPRLAAMADENDEEIFGHLPPEQKSILLAALRAIADFHGLKRAPID